MEKQSEEVKKLLAELNNQMEKSDSETDLEALILSAQFLESAIEMASQVKFPEDFSSVNGNDLTVFVSSMTKNAEKLLGFYEQIYIRLPSGTKESLTAKLISFKDAIINTMAVNDRQIRLLVDEIAEKQTEKLELEQSLKEKVAEIDQLSTDVGKLEKTIRKYADSNQQIINSIPHKLFNASEKMKQVEVLLGEIDEELKKSFEEHQRSANVMEKVTA